MDKHGDEIVSAERNVPLGKPREAYHQMNLFELGVSDINTEEAADMAPLCRIQNWRKEAPVIFHELKGEK